MLPAHADRGRPTWATQDNDGLVKQPHPLRLPLRHIPSEMHLRRQRDAAQIPGYLGSQLGGRVSLPYQHNTKA